MHGTLDRNREADSETLFFAPIPDSVNILTTQQHRSTYGARRNPNWGAILTILLVHVVAFYALVKFDVIHVAPKPKVLVVDLIAEPPAPPTEKPKPEPVVVEKVQPAVITPAPVVQTLAPPPPPISVTTAPPPVKPVVQAPPPSGPVTVGNLDERLIDYQLPKFPRESRIKKEQGTLVVRLLIGTDGHVVEATIAESCGFTRLDQAFLQAVKKWRWRPLMRDGQPVEMRATMPFTWALT